MFTLDQVVPWGRSFAEYQQLFALTPADLERRDPRLRRRTGGLQRRGHAARRAASSRAIRCMPSAASTSRRGSPRPATPSSSRPAATPTSSSGGTASPRSTSWARSGCGRCASSSTTTTPARRRAATSTPACPSLPFADGSFDLALCSHLLFLYSAQFDEAFHRASIREMCRVAAEVRIFPLLALDGSRSPFVEACRRGRAPRPASRRRSNAWTTSSSVAGTRCCALRRSAAAS